MALTFETPLKSPMTFGILSKILPTKGNLAWEYNPFRNYRLSGPKYYFRGKYFTKEELGTELGKPISEDHSTKDWDGYRFPDLLNGIKSDETDPELFDENQLVDFETNELGFSLSHPVNVLPQYSYDGSVNLIINDGKNVPRLINSRFSPIGRNQYQIVDRKGNNDTNIYDQGEQFDIDTSLYKTYTSIPKLEFINVYSGGNLSVGNYHFYFRYVDADGNETDFVAESGLVSVFKGTTLSTITSGFRNENSQKSVKFILSNIDSAYSYVNVYYTKSTSDINQNATVQAYKIDQKFPINNSLMCQIFVTGNEPKQEITVEEINPHYQIAQNVQTQESCQNMLFLGNIQDQTIEYSELSDLSLRFCIGMSGREYTPVDSDYSNAIEGTYSDPKFIYNHTGYQNGEIYRLGVVYLMDNGTLSPVFNIRGMYFDKSSLNVNYTEFSLFKDDKRNYVTFNEDTGIVYKDTTGSSTNEYLENAFGVVRIFSDKDELKYIRGIRIGLSVGAGEEEKFFEQLKKCNVKGLFFVRQKRMPLRLCQAYTIGIDAESHTPLLYVNKDTAVASGEETTGDFYIAERFINDEKELKHDIEDRLYRVKTKDVAKYGAICPEYDVNSPYLNTLFCGDEYIVMEAGSQEALTQNPNELRHFVLSDSFQSTWKDTFFTTRVLGVEDNTKLVAIGDKMFSSRAGEAEEAHRFEFITKQNKTSEATNLVRGAFGPYIAFDGYNVPGTLVNIYIKDWMHMSTLEQFKLRYNDKAPFYAISERYSWQDIKDNLENLENLVLYRGDSYICTFTHRVNRNFQDPSAPINHQIVDYECWKNNFSYKDSNGEESGILNMEDFEKINLGDVNAVKLGMWVTFPLVSSINLNIRSLDDSIVDETALTGHPRGFFPYSGMVPDGAFKTPEALCYNKGFDKSLSERWNHEVPDVPAIKNDFSNRISYSDIHINDAFKNGFRVFQGTHYRDYPKTYGSITKLVEINEQLLCIFEHGVALIPVNERALAGEGTGGNIYVNTSNVLPERMNVISDTFGSQWRDSVIKTPKGVYGVDTVARKIWRCNGQDFQVISDFNVQEFLNNNISLTERELDPIVGVRNVKTHYNRFKQDVMFTFYDNLYGFEEKVWNLCWNEVLGKWITFYSWVPSYSENIYNQYFSFDRNTSKWIAKLGVSKHNNAFSDGVTLSDNIIPNTLAKGADIGELFLDNRTLPTGEGVISYVDEFKIVRDSLRNDLKFKIRKVGSGKDAKHYLVLNTDIQNLFSEYYERVNSSDGSPIYSDEIYEQIKETLKKTPTDSEILSTSFGNAWVQSIKSNTWKIPKDDRGRRKWLSNEAQINNVSPVTLINIQAHIKVERPNVTPELVESFNNTSAVDAGYYQSTVAVCPKYNMQFLTTDFWKHGQAGIIDIADKIYPTYWYGKQHPFEFEFVVAGDPRTHKIFDSLQIISNKAAPESFHYEIVGECYDFAWDKKNMYIRQEATKELYQYNGSNILFDNDYSALQSEHELIPDNTRYKKSTIFPLYYSRQKGYNEIEDYYHLKDGSKQSKDYKNLTGSEIVRYENLNEYRICTHAKAVDIRDSGGRLRGNMQYREDKWYVQINPINLVQRNEEQWKDLDGNNTTMVPVELSQSPIPEDLMENIPTKINVPESFGYVNNAKNKRGVIKWNWEENQMREIKLKDKFIKIRVRYSGEDLTLIASLNTLYSISVS